MVTNVTLEISFPFVCLPMKLKVVPVREALSTLSACNWLITEVQLLNVDLEVCFAPTGGGAVLTLEHRLVAGVDQFVSFQAVGLSKSGIADITEIGFLPCVNPHVALKFVRVRAGICTRWTLIRPLPCMGAEMTFQFAEFHTGVITFRAFVGFLKGVAVADVTHKLP